MKKCLGFQFLIDNILFFYTKLWKSVKISQYFSNFELRIFYSMRNEYLFEASDSERYLGVASLCWVVHQSLLFQPSDPSLGLDM